MYFIKKIPVKTNTFTFSKCSLYTIHLKNVLNLFIRLCNNYRIIFLLYTYNSDSNDRQAQQMINDLIIRGIYRDLSMNSIQLLCFVAGFPVSYLLSNLLTSTRTITVYYSILKLLCKLCLQYLQSEVQDCIFTSEIVLKSSQSFSFPTSSSQCVLFFTSKVAKFFDFFVFLKYRSQIK